MCHWLLTCVLFLLLFSSSFIFCMVLSHEIKISSVTKRQNISVHFTIITDTMILLVKWQLTIRSRRSSMSLMYLPNSANEWAVTRAKNSFISRHNILALSRITLFDPYDFSKGHTLLTVPNIQQTENISWVIACLLQQQCTAPISNQKFAGNCPKHQPLPTSASSILQSCCYSHQHHKWQITATFSRFFSHWENKHQNRAHFLTCHCIRPCSDINWVYTESSWLPDYLK